MRNIILFGYGPYGKEIAHSLRSSAYDVLIVDQYSRHLDAAIEDGFKDTVQINVHDHESIKEVALHDESLVFCAFEDEAYNTYLTISLRAINEHATIFAIGQSQESVHKLRMAGASKVIVVELTAAHIIYNMLINPSIKTIFDEILYGQYDLQIAAVKVKAHSGFDGLHLNELIAKITHNVIVLGLVDIEYHEDFIFSTTGFEHIINAGDSVVFIGPSKEIAACKKEFE